MDNAATQPASGPATNTNNPVTAPVRRQPWKELVKVNPPSDRAKTMAEQDSDQAIRLFKEADDKFLGG